MLPFLDDAPFFPRKSAFSRQSSVAPQRASNHRSDISLWVATGVAAAVTDGIAGHVIIIIAAQISIITGTVRLIAAAGNNNNND